mmetsp:Transcript_31364/g.66790  ORF Transcript_31364/g.66790 Transcript_31364/m.66790 type:complete len:237 (-) Transcript_31364:267-977(-)|eukprot:CAMPEP_0172533988 /NCGR_PEP_ID=MMETSP1067-20121228/6515_1 /TAXON_ID=265564 ORGANISM="Thalassiosira punctigera, Strain Tpunct2005C2" /NCGR_SAMPLE_ID=MMETSP1067 /ASSEMBLY_ACC=CAM_ASM_000444 /LENGTH=236 /DNA_ID=CAMNT_0013318715 /DNA_START=108 /DNA_END=818 /DNA_ORIENTATION=-
MAQSHSEQARKSKQCLPIPPTESGGGASVIGTVPLAQYPPDVQHLSECDRDHRAYLQYVPPHNLCECLLVELPVHDLPRLHERHMIREHLKVLVQVIRHREQHLRGALDVVPRRVVPPQRLPRRARHGLFDPQREADGARDALSGIRPRRPVARLVCQPVLEAQPVLPRALLAERSLRVAVIGGPDVLLVGVVEGNADGVGGDPSVKAVEAPANNVRLIFRDANQQAFLRAVGYCV